MTEPRAPALKLCFWMEMTAWLAISTSFLAAYTVYFGNSLAVVPAHLFLLSAFWAGGVGLRALFWDLLGSQRGTPYVAALLAVLPWLIVVLWYGVALIGLVSWGRVTTWPIIRVYAGQYPFLLSSLGLPSWLAWAPVLLAAALVGVVGRSPCMRPDWPSALSRIGSRRQGLMLALLLSALPVVLGAMMFKTSPMHSQEPIALSLFPILASRKESNAFSSSPAVNAAEATARLDYKATMGGQPRNVILIVGDALRADHMGIYGYERATTPYLSALAAADRLEVVPRVRAVCAESVCGYMAIAASRPIHAMPTNPFTLHEALRRNGYKTHLILSGDHTNFYGLRDMYGTVDSYFDGSGQHLGKWGRSRYINDDQLVIDQVSKLPSFDRLNPIMLQIVLMSTHGLGTRHDFSNRFKPSLSYYGLFRKKTTGISPADMAAVVRYYDNGVYQFDSYVRTILASLEEKGYLQNALVVITGDHGEMLGEFDLVAHGVGVHEPVLSIPFALARFGYSSPALVSHEVASQVDIAPTILAELGITAPPTWIGEPLQKPKNRPVVYFQQEVEAGLYDPSGPRLMKYWRNFATGDEFAYAIETDPQERRNLIGRTGPGQIAAWRMQIAHGGLQVGTGGLYGTERPLDIAEALESTRHASPSARH